MQCNYKIGEKGYIIYNGLPILCKVENIKVDQFDVFKVKISNKWYDERKVYKKLKNAQDVAYNIDFTPSTFHNNRPDISLNGRKKLIKLYNQIIKEEK